MNAKFDELTIYIEELSKINFKFSVICLQETWLSDDVDLSIFQIAGYDCISQGKSCSKKGGLIIYIDNKFDSELVINLNTYKYWEGIVIKVSGGGLQNSTVIFNLYRPPKPGNDILKEVVEELTPVLECIERQNANIILAGDTNINLLKMHENIMYCDFFDVLMAHNLCPHITFPTRFSNKNGTLIDNIFCKLLPCTQEHCSGILIKKLSDHLPCFMLINSQTRKRPPPKYMTIKKLTQHALLNIQNDLVEKNIYDKLDQSLMADVNQNYNIMHQEIYDTIEKHTLKKTVKLNKHKHKISKWITHGIIKSIKYRDRLYKTLKMTHHESPNYTILKVNLKAFNTILKKTIRAAKYMYYESTFSRNKTNIKNTWKTINEIISKSPPKKQFPTFFRDGRKEITENCEIANKFNTLFTNIGPDQSKNINYTGDKTYKTYLKEPNKVSLIFEKVSETNVMQIINNLPNKTSCGFDGISTIVMKSIKHVILKSLTLIINQIINTGVFPNKLKIAKITPIFKKDDRTLFTNYRPISLLQFFSKVIEKVICIQINDFFVENNFFFNHQCGFRSGHSTELAALELTDRIISALDNHNTPLNIFLDLSKAFDTLDHTILSDKLLYYGIRGTAYNLLRSYLANREQFVELNDTASKTLHIVTGVPQGSILGPLLFLIYINDFPLSSNFFEFIMHADDTQHFIANLIMQKLQIMTLNLK